RIALRTQQIVAFESGVTDTVDPLAGSYFIESLTNEVEQKAWQLIQKIDAMGGSVSAIEEGFMQNEIAKSSYDYQCNIESNQKIIVGVNKFTIDKEEAIPAFKIDDSIRQVQSNKLQNLKDKRNNQKATNSLKAIEAAAINNTNLMPVVIEAVENYCTLGEIADCLRKVFGEYK
ncbi:MAG TPA: methylmalonyl-CoA mutase family protein, partial [Chitinophagaceae bacterium]|nr:methylmalonyl-CoA mutase family protein [Chitinophagaceae bacterium]